MRAILLISLTLAFLTACNEPSPGGGDQVQNEACRAIDHSGSRYTVCTFSAAKDDIRLFHSDAAGAPYLQFDILVRELDEQGETLLFAMNGGMYHEDRRPVGFYRDRSGDQASVNTNDGPGNFHMRPNGVFWLTSDRAGVTESETFLTRQMPARYATQSGPMLVIDGAVHPQLSPRGTSRKRRNGVGVSADGLTVHFAISDGTVTFYEFATLFRDTLNADNALFLDGQVSRLYAPGIDRNDAGFDMGPIVGVVE